MKVLFLTISFPERIQDRNIYKDLMDEIKGRGDSVYVVTAREEKYKKPTEISIEDGITVLRVRTGNLQKVNIFEKGISTVRIEEQFIEAIQKHLADIKFDLVIYSTPPVTFEKVIKYIKRRDDARSYLLLKDIFPQNAVDIQMMKKGSILYKYFRKKEIELYKISDFIGCMSPENVNYTIKNNDFLRAKNIEVCPNSIKPIKVVRSKEFIEGMRDKYEIPKDKLVLVYGGNLGKPQGIDFLMEVLEANKNRKDIYFLIAGSGTEYTKLKNFMKKANIENGKLKEYLPKEDYDKLIQACDIGMIFLDKRFTIPNFPSRLLSYMEAYLPVIAATDENTDLGDIITEGGFGFWSKSGDLEAFNSNVDRLCSEPKKLIEMGYKGRWYLEDNYTVAKTYDIIMQHFK